MTLKLVTSFEDILIPEETEEFLAIILPPKMTETDIRKIFETLPIENDHVNVYQGNKLIIDGVPKEELINS